MDHKEIYRTACASYQVKKAERARFLAPLDHKSFDFQLSTWFGSGLIIPAPGTWGTIGGLIFGLILWSLTNGFFVFVAAIILFFVGLQSVERLEKKLDDHDPSFIVIDEVAAILLILSFNSLMISWMGSLGVGGHFPTIVNTVTFLLFRYFDAKKPGYIGIADKEIKGAWGVMMDDIIAAVYTIGASILLFIAIDFLSIFVG
jgi:phosphatidylglycerophosphatase A